MAVAGFFLVVLGQGFACRGGWVGQGGELPVCPFESLILQTRCNCPKGTLSPICTPLASPSHPPTPRLHTLMRTHTHIPVSLQT